MSKFFFCSKYGDISFLALQLKREGHDTRLFITSPECKNVYDGLVDKTNKYDPARDETVIFDSKGFGKQASQLQRQGISVIGGSLFADAIEQSRELGINLMHQHGINTPLTQAFKAPRDGMDFLKTQDGEWFYKSDSNIVTCAGPVDFLVRYLAQAKPGPYILQKKILGQELSFEGWFDGIKFVHPFSSTIEDKRLFYGDLGPDAGCMGNVVWAYENPLPRLAIKTLQRIAPMLVKAAFVGPIGINTILDDNGEVNGLGWTHGFNKLQTLSMLSPANFGEQLTEFVHGRLPRFDIRAEYAFAVNVSIPPFPYTVTDINKYPLDRTLLDHPGRVILHDIMINDIHLPNTTGKFASIANIGGISRDLPSLRNEVFNLIKQFKIPSLQYRQDAGEKAFGTIAYLREHDYDLPFIKNDPIDISFAVPAPAPPRQPAPARPARPSLRPSKATTTLQYPSPDPAPAPTFGDS